MVIMLKESYIQSIQCIPTQSTVPHIFVLLECYVLTLGYLAQRFLLRLLGYGQTPQTGSAFCVHPPVPNWQSR